jgi:hypothetical protein
MYPVKTPARSASLAASRVGNFGDGHINAFDPTSRAFLGQLNDTNGKVIAIDGLWGLATCEGGNEFYGSDPDNVNRSSRGRIQRRPHPSRPCFLDVSFGKRAGIAEENVRH